MFKSNKYFTIILLSLYLSGCAKSPELFSDISSTDAYISTESLEASNYIGFIDSSSNESTHIGYEIIAHCDLNKSMTRKIKFNLDLPEAPLGTAFQYNYPMKSGYEIENIISVFFGRSVDEFVFDESSLTYYIATEQDGALASLVNNDLLISTGRYAELNYLPNNYLQNFDETEINIDENEAISICEDFLLDCGISGYTYDFTLYYGAIDKPFFLIYFCYQLNNMPCASHISDMQGKSYLTFFVDEEGLAEIRGTLYDNNSFKAPKAIDLSTIISPQDAIHYIEKKAAVIRLSNYNPLFDKYYGNKEGLLYVPICNMKLGYWFSEYDGYKLAWIFSTAENGINEYGATFGIDALDGSVLNNI